jgi:hypothetical protein
VFVVSLALVPRLCLVCPLALTPLQELVDGTDQSDAPIIFARRDGVLFPAPFVYSAVRREIVATRGS